MRRRQFSSWWLVFPAVLIFLQLLYLSPLITHLGAVLTFLEQPLWEFASSGSPLFRTFSFALVAAFAEVALGFGIAQRLRISNPRVRQLMTLLLVPALIGSTAVGFVFRNLPSYVPSLLHRSPLSTWAALLAVEVWQYAPMCVYLLWSRRVTIPANLEAFATASSLTQSEAVRHVIWPHCRNLAFVLALFGFLQAASEYSKTDLIFDASHATKTELMSHWIEQHHRMILKDFPVTARDLALAYSGLLMLGALLMSILIAFVVTLTIGALVRGWMLLDRPSDQGFRLVGAQRAGNKVRKSNPVWAFVLIVVTLLPFLQLPVDLFRHGTVPTARVLLDAASMIIGGCAPIAAAALLITTTTISFGIALRLVLPKHTEKFNSKSVPVLSSILALHAVPAIGLAYCALYWFHRIHNQGIPMSLYWALGETVLGFSVIGAFSIYVHFDLLQREIDFLRSAQVTLRETARDILLRRFRLSYFIVALFAFTVVLNEDTISSVLAVYLDTPITELQKRTLGPGADYPQAALMILFVMTLVITGIYLLNLALRKQARGGLELHARIEG